MKYAEKYIPEMLDSFVKHKFNDTANNLARIIVMSSHGSIVDYYVAFDDSRYGDIFKKPDSNGVVTIAGLGHKKYTFDIIIDGNKKDSCSIEFESNNSIIERCVIIKDGND